MEATMLSNNIATRQVYRMILGTSGRQWEQLTVKEDGTMMLYFYGTDRSVTQQVSAVTEGEWKGWLKSEKGSMWPGLESGRWQAVDDVIVVEPKPIVPVESEPIVTNSEPIVSVVPEPIVTNSEPIVSVVPEPIVNQPRPRRQRKPRKQRVERQEPLTVNPEPLTVNRQTSDTLKAIGMVAAATVALLVIYETGLLIPLGLIGLATSGFLK